MSSRPFQSHILSIPSPPPPPDSDDATEDDVKSLIAEMEQLSGLGQHPNIVSLIRVCTVGSEWSYSSRYLLLCCIIIPVIYLLITSLRLSSSLLPLPPSSPLLSLPSLSLPLYPSPLSPPFPSLLPITSLLPIPSRRAPLHGDGIHVSWGSPWVPALFKGTPVHVYHLSWHPQPAPLPQSQFTRHHHHRY